MDDTHGFSTELLEFMESRRKDALETQDLWSRAAYLLDTLGLAYGIITELGARTFLESAGVEITPLIKELISGYHNSGALEIMERYALDSVVCSDTVFSDSPFGAHLEKLKYDGVFFREMLVPSL